MLEIGHKKTLMEEMVLKFYNNKQIRKMQFTSANGGWYFFIVFLEGPHIKNRYMKQRIERIYTNIRE